MKLKNIFYSFWIIETDFYIPVFNTDTKRAHVNL